MIYKYEIIRVDEPSRVMDVAYTHETHGVLHVGVRLPFVGEGAETVIAQFAPVAYWRDLETPVEPPVAGSIGSIEVLQQVQVDPNEVPV